MKKIMLGFALISSVLTASEDYSELYYPNAVGELTTELGEPVKVEYDGTITDSSNFLLDEQKVYDNYGEVEAN